MIENNFGILDFTSHTYTYLGLIYKTQVARFFGGFFYFAFIKFTVDKSCNKKYKENMDTTNSL